jgi:hypothetical protein
MELKFLLAHADALKKILERENVCDFLKSHSVDEIDILELQDRLNDILSIFVKKNVKEKPIEFEEISFGN